MLLGKFDNFHTHTHPHTHTHTLSLSLSLTYLLTHQQSPQSFSTRTTTNEYFVGGRRVNALTIAISLISGICSGASSTSHLSTYLSVSLPVYLSIDRSIYLTSLSLTQFCLSTFSCQLPLIPLPFSCIPPGISYLGIPAYVFQDGVGFSFSALNYIISTFIAARVFIPYFHSLVSKGTCACANRTHINCSPCAGFLHLFM